MAEERRLAEDYLAADQAGFWTWNDTGQEIAWSDGVTITFLPELAVVLARLQDSGLPPFGAVLLLVAACRNSWRESANRRDILAARLPQQEESQRLLSSVCEGLDRIHEIPADLKQSPAAKAELAAMVFERAPGRLGPLASALAVELLPTFWASQSLVVLNVGLTTNRLERELGALASGLAGVSAKALQWRLETGLDQPPAPAEMGPPRLNGLALLGALEQDDEFAGVGTLARRLLDLASIPRRLRQEEDLPLGGVTDIAPRGPLDRLLLSELAQDDLTLAVRVAMREALYLRRESPPKSQPRRRFVLLDACLRSWGLPRVYATAVGLALAVRQERDVQLSLFRAEGKDAVPIELSTLVGLRSHLAALDHRLHPGEALAEFAREWEDAADSDAVIVTTFDAFGDPDFRRYLDALRDRTLYLVLLARDGRLEWLHWSRTGHVRIRQAVLPIDEILKTPARRQKLLEPASSDLPGVLRLHPNCPLLFSAQRTLENSWMAPSLGLITLTGEGRLLRWTDSRRGGAQLAAGLPEGTIVGVSKEVSSAGEVCLVVGRRSPQGMHAVWLNKEGVVQRIVHLLSSQPHLQTVTVDRHVVFVQHQNQIEAVSLESGTSLGWIELPHGADVCGLFVRSPLAQVTAGHWENAWHRMTCLGASPSLAPVYRNALDGSTPYLDYLFEIDGVEGPVGLTAQGKIVDVATGAVRELDRSLSRWTVAAVSRRGDWVMMQSGATRILVDLVRGKASDIKQSKWDYFIEPNLSSFAPPRNVLRRLIAVGVDSSGQMYLKGRKQHYRMLQSPELLIVHKHNVADCQFRSFVPAPRQTLGGVELAMANFPDGGAAVLDARGLMHLRSGDRRLPECSIVLAEGANSGWCSDGRMWGSPYFCGDHPVTPAADIYREIIQPILERWT